MGKNLTFWWGLIPITSWGEVKILEDIWDLLQEVGREIGGKRVKDIWDLEVVDRLGERGRRGPGAELGVKG